MIRILIVDDHPLIREALKAAIADETDLQLVAEAANGRDALVLTSQHQPDVIVMDLFMPQMDGVTAIRAILNIHPLSQILVLTSATDEENIIKATRAGALGFIQKDSQRSEILNAIRTIAQGQTYLHPAVAGKILESIKTSPHPSHQALDHLLTSRERQVLQWIGQGASNAEIASQLFISQGTVRTHIHNILQKLQLENRHQVILYAIQHLGNHPPP